jgi:hypothetical protein
MMDNARKPIDRINLLTSERRSNQFPVKYEYYPSCVLNERQDDG